MWRPIIGVPFRKVQLYLEELISESVYTNPIIERRINEHENAIENRKPTIESREFNRTVRQNISNSVDHLIYGMLWHDNGFTASAVNHAGQKVDLTIGTLKPETSCVSTFRSPNYPNDYDDVFEGDFGPRRFLDKSWVESFGDGNCFQPAMSYKPNQPNMMRMVNSALGVIDLEPLREVVEKHDAARVLNLKSNGELRFGNLFRGIAEDRNPHALLKHYQHIEGWVVVFEGPFDPQDFKTSGTIGKGDGKWGGLSAWRRIMEIKTESPDMKKEEVKAQHFPEYSVRQFDRQWKAAADILPWISSPGRKK